MNPPDALNAHCISCGYDLAGLAEHAVCPECGSDTESAHELRHFLEGNHKRLTEISIGLAATLIGYALITGAIVYGILNEWFLLPPELSIAVFVITLVGAGGALLAGFAETTTPLLFPESLKPAFSHSGYLGFAALGCVACFVVVLPLMFVIDTEAFYFFFPALMAASACTLVLGHARLAAELVSVLHNASLARIAKIGSMLAYINFGLSLLLIAGALISFDRGTGTFFIGEKVFAISFAANVLAYPILHIGLAFADRLAIRRILRHSPPPATPAAL